MSEFDPEKRMFGAVPLVPASKDIDYEKAYYQVVISAKNMGRALAKVQVRLGKTRTNNVQLRKRHVLDKHSMQQVDQARHAAIGILVAAKEHNDSLEEELAKAKEYALELKAECEERKQEYLRGHEIDARLIDNAHGERNALRAELDRRLESAQNIVAKNGALEAANEALRAEVNQCRVLVARAYVGQKGEVEETVDQLRAEVARLKEAHWMTEVESKMARDQLTKVVEHALKTYGDRYEAMTAIGLTDLSREEFEGTGQDQREGL